MPGPCRRARRPWARTLPNLTLAMGDEGCARDEHATTQQRQDEDLFRVRSHNFAVTLQSAGFLPTAGRFVAWVAAMALCPRPHPR